MRHRSPVFPPVLALTLTLAACDGGAPDPAIPEGDRCFPVPPSATFRAGPKDQGRSLQGGEAPGEEAQGPSLQGGNTAGPKNQGRSLQGPAAGHGDAHDQLAAELAPRRRPGMETQGRFLGITDLMGVTIVLEATAAPVELDEGQLRADGHPTTVSLVGVPMRATTSDGRGLALEIVQSRAEGRDDHVELVVEGEPACTVGEFGVFVSGHWNDRGDHIDDPSALTFSCDGGVIAKCVAWGYTPWVMGSDVHQACTRLARADYCGDGTPWTLDGTTIDAYDAMGVQEIVPDATLHFEAAWGPEGAVCVAQTRYDVIDVDGRRALPACFAALPTCDRLEHPAAASALLADRSAHTPIAACD